MRAFQTTDKLQWNSLTFRPIVRTLNVTSAQLTSGGLTQTINIGAVVPDTFIPFAVRLRLDDAFNSAGAASLSVEVGCVGDTDRFVTAFDCYTGSVYEGAEWKAGTVNATPAIGVPTNLSLQLQALFTSTVNNLNEMTDGDVTIEVWGWELDAAP